MNQKQIVSFVEELLQPIITENGFELVEVEYVKEGPNWYLRVYLDQEGGITINDCALVNRYLSNKMDEEDPIANAYIIEVSSPGLERPLKKPLDYEKYKGTLVEVKLYKALEGTKVFLGTLEGLVDGVVTITDDEGVQRSFPLNTIANCKRAIIF